MSQPIQTYSITAPGFYGLNTQDSSLDLASGFALVANNCVIDKYGRIGARKGWIRLHNTSDYTLDLDFTTETYGYDYSSALGTSTVKSIGELITAAGVSYVILAGNNKIWKLLSGALIEVTYGGGGVAPTITDNNWQIATLNGKLYLFQTGHDPLVFDPSVSTSTYRRVSEVSGYNGTVQQSNCVISAYGRLWNAVTSSNKVLIQWSDLLAGHVYQTGSAGTLDLTNVWPKNSDNIVALGAHNGFLFVFGKNNILIYQNASDPSAMSLYDVVTGIGCEARDTVCNTGTDIIFLSSTGVRSVLRTIQEKSAPFRDLSKNVRDDLLVYVSGSNKDSIKAVYSPLDAFYLLSFPNSNIVYCFDMRNQLPDGSARVTTWDSLVPYSFCVKADSTLLVGLTGYLGKYSGYLDDTATYYFQYFTNNTDFGAPSVTSILKKLSAIVIGGSDQDLVFKWGYDFTGDYQASSANIPSQGVAYYGVAEYNISEYAGGTSLQTLVVYPTGSGKIVQTGYETDINGTALSIQKIEIQAKNGKVV